MLKCEHYPTVHIKSKVIQRDIPNVTLFLRKLLHFITVRVHRRVHACVYAKRAHTCMNGTESIEASTELIASSLITRLDLVRKYDGGYNGVHQFCVGRSKFIKLD